MVKVMVREKRKFNFVVLGLLALTIAFGIARQYALL